MRGCALRKVVAMRGCALRKVVTWRTKTGKPGSRTPAPPFTDPATSANRLFAGELVDGRKTGRRGKPKVAG